MPTTAVATSDRSSPSHPNAPPMDLLSSFGQLVEVHGEALSLARLVEAGIDRLPLLGGGDTLGRWRVLAAVAAHDLSLVKLFEGHTDALAILRELDGPAPVAGSRWGTWCAEPPDARLAIEPWPADPHTGPAGGSSSVRLRGRKAWCSGAHEVTHALVSGWNAQGEPCLAAVALDQPGVRRTHEGWQAVGMGDSGSFDILFDDVQGEAVGGPRAYLERPGFWQGGAGIAACWYGGAMGIARRVRRSAGQGGDPHRLAHLGAIDTALAGAGALLRQVAGWIDGHPRHDAQAWAMRARLAIEAACTEVLSHAGGALGAGPMCRERGFARAMADLPVFLRQSHGERDLASLGRLRIERQEEPDPWML